MTDLVDPLRPLLTALESALEVFMGINLEAEEELTQAQLAWLEQFDSLNDREDLNRVHEERLAGIFERYLNYTKEPRFKYRLKTLRKKT